MRKSWKNKLCRRRVRRCCGNGVEVGTFEKAKDVSRKGMMSSGGCWYAATHPNKDQLQESVLVLSFLDIFPEFLQSQLDGCIN